MIEKYSMFYRRNKHFDALVVVFNYGNKATKYVRNGDLGIVYSNDEIIGYNFFNISKIVKIRTKNMIYLPSEALIDVLNTLLGKKYPRLSYKETSGFMITGVHEIAPYNDQYELYYIVTGPKELTACLMKKDAVNKNTYFVLAEKDTMLPNGKIVDKSHPCTGFDLGINDDKDNVYELDDMYTLGSDFFRMEEE